MSRDDGHARRTTRRVESTTTMVMVVADAGVARLSLPSRVESTPETLPEFSPPDASTSYMRSSSSSSPPHFQSCCYSSRRLPLTHSTTQHNARPNRQSDCFAAASSSSRFAVSFLPDISLVCLSLNTIFSASRDPLTSRKTDSPLLLCSMPSPRRPDD